MKMLILTRFQRVLKVKVEIRKKKTKKIVDQYRKGDQKERSQIATAHPAVEQQGIFRAAVLLFWSYSSTTQLRCAENNR